MCDMGCRYMYSDRQKPIVGRREDVVQLFSSHNAIHTVCDTVDYRHLQAQPIVGQERELEWEMSGGVPDLN